MSLVVDGVTYGLTDAGFVPKTLLVIKGELEADFQATFGANIDLDAAGPFGQLIGLFSDRLSEAWEVTAAVVSAQNPDAAEGLQLVQDCALTGTIPEQPLPSTVTLSLTGTNNTLVAAGKTASVAGTGRKFDTLADAVLATATSWVAATTYAQGVVVTNGGNCYSCDVGGTSAGSGGPSGTGTAITDNTVTWRYVGLGTAYATVPAQSEEYGSIVAEANTLSVIETPVSGWQGVSNLLDATLGRAPQTDADLRAQREDEIDGASASVVGAIHKTVSEVAGVTSVIVFQNETDTTDGNGLPPHSVEVLVRGGADQDVTDAVYESKPGGIGTYGNQTGTHVDADNGDQSYAVNWSRPTVHDVYVIGHVLKDPDAFPDDGSDQMAAAIAAFGATFSGGRDVVASAISAQCFKVAGVLDVTALYIGTSPSPASSTTLTMALRDLALFDTSRISFVLTDGSP